MARAKNVGRFAAFLRPILVGLAMLSGGAHTLGGPRERDVWHAYVEGDVRYGYEHVTVTELPDGNFQYVVQSRGLVDFVGARQETTRRAVYVVTPAYEPVSLKSEGAEASGKSSGAGRVEGGQLVVTFERVGLRRDGAVPLSDKPIFDVCLDDWLNDQPADLQSTTVNVINEQSCGVQPGTAQRRSADQPGSVWHVDLGPELGQGTLSYDVDGVREEARFNAPRIHIKRSTADEAKQIRHLKPPARFLLMFPLNQNVTTPEQLTSLTVSLTWKDIPFDRFQLEDDRQHVIEKAEKDGRYRVVLRVGRPEPLPGDVKHPIKGKEFEPYLAETRFIKPHDAQIAARARQWTQGKESALDATRALCTAVFDYLEGGSLITETLSGPEVLRCKKGKCSECTTLLASLARSVGLPTRVVLGERMTAGNWIGHMWCEVYVGRWITVDASANEVGDSMALLKLIHSDSVMGTQTLRWALTESLDVSIDDFTQLPSLLADELKTGIEGRVYTNADFACRLTAPASDWSVEDKSKPGIVTVRFHVPKRDDVLVHFVAFSLPAGLPPKVLVDAREAHFKQIYQDFEVLENEQYKKNGITGQLFVFRRTSKGDQQKKMKTTEVIWIRGSFGHLLNLIAEESAHDKYAEDFYKLLASFEDLKEATHDAAPEE